METHPSIHGKIVLILAHIIVFAVNNYFEASKGAVISVMWPVESDSDCGYYFSLKKFSFKA